MTITSPYMYIPPYIKTYTKIFSIHTYLIKILHSKSLNSLLLCTQKVGSAGVDREIFQKGRGGGEKEERLRRVRENIVGAHYKHIIIYSPDFFRLFCVVLILYVQKGDCNPIPFSGVHVFITTNM